MTGGMRRFRSLALAAATAVAALAAPPPSLAESDGAPWVLDANNWQEGKDLLPEPVLKRLEKGEYWFKVVPTDPAKFRSNFAKKFWDASESNAGKFDLDPETCGLRDKSTQKIPDFVVGLPFPKVDPKEPDAACKIAHNFSFVSAMGGGGGATFSLNGVDGNGEFRRIKAFIHLLAFQGRLDGKMDKNPENLAGTGLSGALEPQDVEGVSQLTKRFWDWESQDALWAYVPSTRRARRVNAATRSDPVAGLDIFGDDLNCYAGKVEYYKWKLVGEGKILAPVISTSTIPVGKQLGPTRWDVPIPYLKAGYEAPGSRGAPWWIQENLVFVPRPAWIVEGQSTDPYYNFGKVIMYFDKEMYRIYFKLVHNRAGEYFYAAMCGYQFVKLSEDYGLAAQNMVLGVNDKINRAALAGRYSSFFIERRWDPNYFSLRTITHMTD
jgi:hypothetical protein